MKPREIKAESVSASVRVAGVETTVSFGSVTVKVVRPSAGVVQRNIEDGQAALGRVRDALLKPGVKITRAKGKPLYFGSPDRPDVIIREVDGIRSFGKFVGGRFRKLSGPSATTKTTPAKSAPKEAA